MSGGVSVREGGLCAGMSMTPPRRNMGPETETPLEGTWDQAAREEVTSYRDPLPVDRITDASKNVTLPQTSFALGNNMMLFHSLSTKPLYIE